MDINQYEELTRFMKGVFNERPALPRYASTWLVVKVLKYLQTLKETTLFLLSCKLSMLFLLLTELSDIQITKDKIFITPQHLLKQTKPGKHLDMIVLKTYPKDEYLCIVKVFSEYLERTKGLRVDNKLLISTVKPHKSISKSTLKVGQVHHVEPH